jgi:hypothetical protein
MKRWALVYNGLVQNVVEQDTQPTIGGTWIDVTGMFVGPGFTYDGANFFAPVVVINRFITKYAFRNRFTQVEKEDLELAAAHNPSDTAAAKRQAARIRLWMEDCRNADYIDLGSSRIINGVNAMETAGVVGTGRANTILNAAITDDEAYHRYS